MREMPYFLTNPEWFTESRDESGEARYALTDKAPAEAVESFERFHSQKGFHDENGNSLIPDGWEVD